MILPIAGDQKAQAGTDILVSTAQELTDMFLMSD